MEALFLSRSAIISNKTYVAVGSAPITAPLLSQGLLRKEKSILRQVSLSPSPSPCQRPWWKGAQASPMYQVFELRWEAAIVRLFHVHHFRVCAQNVKFTGPESQEEKTNHICDQMARDKVRLHRTEGSLYAELTLWELQRPRSLC